MFSVSHKHIDPLNDACSLKNETAFQIVNNEITESIKKEAEAENPDHFIPSEEDSVSNHRWLIIFILLFIRILYAFQPVLELILNATNMCSTKFDASSVTIAMDVIKSETPLPSNKGVCYIHCMLSELEFVRSVFNIFSIFWVLHNGMNRFWFSTRSMKRDWASIGLELL